MTENNFDYLLKLREELDQSALNNEFVSCIMVNPKDYNNYILPFLETKANVNYESPYFGFISPPTIFGIKIIKSTHVPEGSFVKSTTDLTNQPFTKYPPIGFKNILE